MNCSAIACVAHDPSVDNSPAEHPHRQHSAHCPSGQFSHNKKPARNRYVAVPSRLVVCARWCPTLPHPGGCSTIGAVRLSFRVRDGCRAFPCRCDHRDVWYGQCSAVLSRVVDSVIGRPPTTVTLCVVWLGGGLGVDRIVDASRLAAVFPVTPTYRPCGGRVGGCGGVLFVSAD